MNHSQIEGLDIHEYSGSGFQTMVSFGTWRIAMASGSQTSITALSRHLETDEVFVLLKGTCTLYLGGNGAAPSSVSIVPMEPQKLYNIRQGTWHARTIGLDSLVLVVENKDTGDFNSESAAVSDYKNRLPFSKNI